MAVAQRQYYIARNTTIPVPRVLDVLGVRMYIPHSAGIHRYARPLMCGTRWQHAMPQLQGYLEQLPALSPPVPGKVQAVDETGMSSRTLE